MAFQNYVYILVGADTMCSHGVYPNFKNAYERLEEIANGDVIYDYNDDDETRRFEFEVVETIKHSFGYWFSKRKYLIFRTLLTIRPEDTLITYYMIDSLEKANQKRDKSKYRLKAEVM